MAARPIDIDAAWELVLQASNRSEATRSIPEGSGSDIVVDSRGGYQLMRPATREAERLLSVFLPLCQPVDNSTASHVIGQLGQSLDGRIATVTGCSRFINGDDGLTHLHRIRAISDAVVVGAGTALTDNPKLTVRRTTGANPVRVVIDRNRRVPASHQLFVDGEAPTLRLVAGHYEPADTCLKPGDVIEVPCLGDDSQTDAADPTIILRVLADFGLRKVFIEGGGVTVSSFLRSGLLNRLHVLVAPMIIGSGRPAISLPEIDLLDDALRPQANFVNLGSDMLFDLEF